MTKERGLIIDWKRKRIPDDVMEKFTEEEKAEAAASFIRLAFRLEPLNCDKQGSKK